MSYTGMIRVLTVVFVVSIYLMTYSKEKVEDIFDFVFGRKFDRVFTRIMIGLALIGAVMMLVHITVWIWRAHYG